MTMGITTQEMMTSPLADTIIETSSHALEDSSTTEEAFPTGFNHLTSMDPSTANNTLNNFTDNFTSDYYYYYYNEDLAEAEDRRIYTRFYMLGIILPVGLFFNTFAFFVFLRSPNIRKTTTGKYLIALTIADNMFLIGDYLRWLNVADRHGQILGLEFTEEYFGWCATMYFLRYFGQLVSGWLTVAITVERFIVVAFPLKASRISTTTTTHTTIALIYVIGATLTCFPYWTITIYENTAYNFKYCVYKDQHEFDKWNWVVIRVASLLLPSIIIFLFTGLIIFKLKRLQENRKGLSTTGTKGKRQALERQLTLMLVSVAVTFLVLRLPYTITYYLFDFKADIWGEDLAEERPWLNHRLWFARDVCDAIAAANHAINFFLYCLTGSQFRSNMASCLRCQNVKTIRSNAYTSTLRDDRHKVNHALSTSNLSVNKIAINANGSPRL